MRGTRSGWAFGVGLALAAGLLPRAAQADGIEWAGSLERAQSVARAQGRPLMVYLHSDT